MTDSAPQTFAGIDAGKVQDVVASVWDHKDDVAAAVAFVREHGDDVLDLVTRVPELLSGLAAAMQEAAGEVGGAAAFLTGGGAPKDGVKALAELAGDALDACRRELADARGLLEKVGAELDDVPVPSVSPTYSTVLGHKIITGLDLGEGKLLGPASEKLRDGAARFDGVGTKLAEVAEQLRRLGAAVDSAGQGLASTASKLADGGAALASVTRAGGKQH